MGTYAKPSPQACLINLMFSHFHLSLVETNLIICQVFLSSLMAIVLGLKFQKEMVDISKNDINIHTYFS